jgi:hypothetical protein
MVTSWVVRDFQAAVQLAEDTRGLPDSTPLNLVDLIPSLRLQAPAVVAVNGDTLIGFITANIVGDRALLDPNDRADTMR